MPPTPHPTLQNPAPRLLQTTQLHSGKIHSTNPVFANKTFLTLGILAIITGGSGLAAAMMLFRRWRQKSRRGVAASPFPQDGVFDLERREAPKKRMQNVIGGWQKGVGSTGEDDMGEDWCNKGWRSEEFEGKDGLGIHFVDVE